MVGTDVPVKELLKTIPKYKVPHHTFLIAKGHQSKVISQPALVTISTPSEESLSLSGRLFGCGQ